MSHKIVQKSCPRCGKQMEVRIPDDDLFKASARLFKVTACGPCSDYGMRLAKIKELEREAWAALSRLLMSKTHAIAARDTGSRDPKLSHRIQTLDKEISGLRSQLRQLEAKKEKVADGWSSENERQNESE